MMGFAVGGPFAAMVGAALGQYADPAGTLPRGLPQQRDQLFAVAVVVLAAKLAKCDGPVNRAEIDMFRSCFRIPDDAARDVGRLFDEARDSAQGYEPYAAQLGIAFVDRPDMLEGVLAALFRIARADAPLNVAEHACLSSIARLLGLGMPAWQRANGGQAVSDNGGEDAYAVLGASRTMSDDDLHTAWKQLMREHHPDRLASRGLSDAALHDASDKVARINAAWDRIKRERGL